MPTPDDLILCSLLRGERPVHASDSTNDARIEALSQLARAHGAQVLLYTHLSSLGWPAIQLQSLRAEAAQRAVWELRHQQVLAHALTTLQAIGIEPVLVKGTSLAYSLYDDPVTRVRGDTDLIIPPHEKGRVHDALVAIGFERRLGVTGEFISYQASYTRSAGGDAHTLDLHWKINNSELLSKLFTYDELRRDAQALAGLCPCALGTSHVHALLLACMHRGTHKQNPYYVDDQAHHNPDRLIWLFDIHLLAGKLASREWEEFLLQAHQKGLRAVCLEGMEQANTCLHTEAPPAVIAALRQAAASERPARYLNGNKNRQQWMDFCALETMPRRLRYARELLFPPAAYMRSKYPAEQSWTLWLYLRRAVRGVMRRLSRGGSGL